MCEGLSSSLSTPPPHIFLPLAFKTSFCFTLLIFGNYPLAIPPIRRVLCFLSFYASKHWLRPVRFDTHYSILPVRRVVFSIRVVLGRYPGGCFPFSLQPSLPPLSFIPDYITLLFAHAFLCSHLALIAHGSQVHSFLSLWGHITSIIAASQPFGGWL